MSLSRKSIIAGMPDSFYGIPMESDSSSLNASRKPEGRGIASHKSNYPSDVHLVKELRRGEIAAAEVFFESWFARIFVFAKASGLHPAEAEEISTVILTDALDLMDEFDVNRPLDPWLFGVARGRIKTLIRSLRRKEKREFPIEQFTCIDEQRTKTSSVGETVEKKELIELVLAELPADWSAALVGYYRDGKSAADIAADIGRTEKAVRRVLERAKEQFKEKYNRLEGGE